MGRNDVDRLIGQFASGRLVPPSADELNFVDLVHAVAHLTGAEGLRLGPGARTIAGWIGQWDHLVLVLVDGLGTKLLSRLPAEGLLRGHLVRELRAVFPSTTAVALTTLATGLWPCEHAVAGWWTYLPERNMTVTTLPFVERHSGQPLAELGVPPEEVFPAPPFWGRMRVDVLAVMPRTLVGSAFTTYSLPMATAGYDSIEEGAERVLDHLSAADTATFTYLYLPQVDALAHEQGLACAGMPALLSEVEQCLTHLAERAGGRTRIVITADHGLVDIPGPQRLLITDDEPFMAHLLCPPTCEASVPAFHVLPGREKDFVRDFQGRYGQHFALIAPEEAEALRLFGPGPISPLLRRRLGTFLGITAENVAMYYRRTDAPVSIAVHAGLRPDEMRIPLILVP